MSEKETKVSTRIRGSYATVLVEPVVYTVATAGNLMLVMTLDEFKEFKRSILNPDEIDIYEDELAELTRDDDE